RGQNRAEPRPGGGEPPSTGGSGPDHRARTGRNPRRLAAPRGHGWPRRRESGRYPPLGPGSTGRAGGFLRAQAWVPTGPTTARKDGSVALPARAHRRASAGPRRTIPPSAPPAGARFQHEAHGRAPLLAWWHRVGRLARPPHGATARSL